MRLRVHPGTHSNQVMGPYGDRLRLNIASPPIGGKANEALISFLAREFATARSQVEIISGQRTRDRLSPITLKPNGAARTWWIQIVIL